MSKTTLERFKELQAEELELFERKNRDYGDTFREEGALGVAIRIKDKLNRFITLARKNGEAAACKKESKRDTLIDNAIYSKMAIIAEEAGMPIGNPPEPKKTVTLSISLDPADLLECINKAAALEDTLRLSIHGKAAPEDKVPPMMYPGTDGF